MSSFSSPSSPSSSSSMLRSGHTQRERQHHQRSGKSKSISSLPAPGPGSNRNLHRLIVSPYIEVNGEQPLYSSASCPPHRSTHTPTSTLSRSSSLRSRHKSTSASVCAASAGTLSPSRLPATDAVSYFPPFEDMGSSTLSPSKNGGVSTEARASHSGLGELPKRGESSRSGSQHEHPHTYKRHGKGRSLGSLAGFMSASISWGLSSISCTSPSTPPFTPMSRKGSEQIQDDVAVQALSKQFTPGKRRVLESFTVHTGDELSQNQAIDSSMTVDKSMDAAGMGMHKRRMRSEVEVDSIVLGPCYSLKGRSRVQAHEVLVDDEEMVEDLVDTQSSLLPRSRSKRRARPRPPLKLLLPTLSNWRFPLGPSPPITCLSPDIPLEAFHITIDNPCVQVSPSHLQQQHSNGVSDRQEEVEDDLDEIDSHLHLDKRHSEIRSRVGSLTPSPATSSTSSFELQPSTPSKSSCMDYDVDIKKHSHLAPSHGDGEYGQHEDMSEKEKLRGGGDSKVEVNSTGIGLERTCSRFSERSCETVKQQVWGRNDEITPKAARVRRLTSSSCKA